MSGKTDSTIGPQSLLIKTGNFGQGVVLAAVGIAKACRKSYTLQNPDFCGPPVFAGSDG